MKRLLSLSFLFLVLVLLSRLGMNQTQLMAAQSEPAEATLLNAVGSQTQVSDSLHSGSVMFMENVAKLGRESGLHIPGSNYKKNALWSALAADEEYVEHIGGDTLADWFAFYDNQSMEWDIPVDMIESSQGGFLLVGRTLNRGSTRPDALWVLKLADSGAVEWQRTYLDGRGRVEDGGVTEVEDGYVILSEESSLAGEILLKIDYDGSIVWQKNFLNGTFQRHDSWSTIDKSSSGVIVGGRTASSLPLLTEIDNDGTVIRSRTFDHRYKQGFTEVRSVGDIRDVVVLEDGKVFVTGRVRFESGEWRQYGFEAWYALLDQEWNVLWERTVGLPNLSSPQFKGQPGQPSSDDSGQEVTVTSDGGFLISASHTDYWSENGNFWTGVHHVWLIKLSADGSIAWQKVYFGDESEGSFNSVLGDVVEVDDGYVGIGANQDGRWLIDFSATGEVEREQSYGSRSWNNYSSEARVIIPTSAGDYVSLNTLPRPSDPDEQDLDLAVARSSDGMLPSCVQLHSEFSPAEVHVGILNPAAPLSSAGSVKFTTEDLESEDFDSEPTESTPEFVCDAGNPDTYSISGQVTDNNDAPLSGIMVVLAGKNVNLDTTTDEDGRYRFDGLEAGNYLITATDDNYNLTPGPTRLTLPPDATHDFVGTTQEETYSISGQVTDNNDAALSGIMIHLVGEDVDRTTTSDSNGRYIFEDLEAGNYLITATDDNYNLTPGPTRLTLPPDATHNFVGTNATVDLSIDQIDIGQVLMAENDPVTGDPIPLIAEKPTLVRVYVGLSGANSQPNVTVRLHIQNAQSQIHTLERKTTTIGLNQNPADLDSTINFMPDVNLLTGNVTIWAEVDPDNEIREIDENNNKGENVVKTFQAGKKLRIAWTRFIYTENNAMYQADINVVRRGDSLLRKIFPVGVNDVEYVWQPGYPQEMDEYFGPATKQYIKALNRFWDRMTHEGVWVGGSRPDRLYGWVPEAGNQGPRKLRSCGRSDPLWSKGGGLVTASVEGCGSDTFAHEIGHILNDQGLRHTPNLAKKDDSHCGTYKPSGPNTKHPEYPDYPLGSIGVYGFDPNIQTLLSPTHYYDFMSYCRPRWVSPYNYSKLADGFPSPNRVLSTVANLQQEERQLLVSGTVHTPSLTVEFDPFYAITSTVPTDDSSGTGYCLEMYDNNNTALESRCFDLAFIDPESDEPTNEDFFTAVVPYPDATSEVVLTHFATSIGTVNVSQNAPEVQLTYPTGGEVWLGTGTYTVTWSASDLDGDQLYYALSYSTDAGNSWIPIGTDMTSNQLALDVSDLPGSSTVLIRVGASDGTNTTYNVSQDTITVGRKPPIVVITTPEEDIRVSPGDPLFLQGSAYDLEDGPIDSSTLQWASSKDGDLATGTAILPTLSEGEHVITLSATDSDNNTATATINVEVTTNRKIYLPLIIR